ncbi:hypothetical protein VOLCADRAFT_97721 [Volvox carteri f. nagariensis]|uniref:Endonuclease/exonuclease/phosphatase domain-containing protein n=1 Tax=Volvox carteri f. nagariensis TaxID=3068 RepID=D8UDG9_VOLCA|nr:uncharacterized protein VOLCADRAFT_97721 [Volvox carteri f. nagariensis]EFJ42310.1 hypothetical protein VOLCADRAFT_97721 [Volvox carteri f. nagariensis]|eukprot:XP_002956708.1 hypothetical protein VOLCADRAFT_97721 [Volvox carteri f. nagariensis]
MGDRDEVNLYGRLRLNAKRSPLQLAPAISALCGATAQGDTLLAVDVLPVCAAALNRALWAASPPRASTQGQRVRISPQLDLHPTATHPADRSYIPSPNSLKVISYNILAPKYASYNSYCPPQFLAWKYRRGGLLRELDHLNPDLLGLQVGPVTGPPEGVALMWREGVLEAVTSRQQLYSKMDPGVAGLPPGVAGTRPWSKLRELGEGVLMSLFRHKPTGRLLVAAVTHLFWNPDFPDVKALQAALLCGSLSTFARTSAAASRRSRRSRVQKNPFSALLFLPYFLLYEEPTWSCPHKAPPHAPDARCARHAPVRLETVEMVEVVEVVEMVEMVVVSCQMIPIWVPPGGLASGVYSLLSHGSLPPKHPDHPATRVWEGEPPAPPGSQRFPAVPLTSAQLQLTSMNAEFFGREPPLTTRTATWAGCIDFVWLSRGDFAVSSALAMPYSDDGLPPLGPDGGGGDGGGREASWRDPFADIAFTAIPDEFFPSDHLAVGGEIMVL